MNPRHLEYKNIVSTKDNNEEYTNNTEDSHIQNIFQHEEDIAKQTDDNALLKNMAETSPQEDISVCYSKTPSPVPTTKTKSPSKSGLLQQDDLQIATFQSKNDDASKCPLDVLKLEDFMRLKEACLNKKHFKKWVDLNENVSLSFVISFFLEFGNIQIYKETTMAHSRKTCLPKRCRKIK